MKNNLPVFVVSLKKDTDRRAIISSKLKELNIPFVFEDAVYGKELSESELAPIKLNEYYSRCKRRATPGEIGCTLSHLSIYKKMIESAVPWAIIFEDDVILDKYFSSFYTSLSSTKLSSLDSKAVLFLGGQDGLSSKKMINTSFWNFLRVGRFKVRKTISSDYYLFRTCCYVIGIDSAKELVSLFQSDFFVADEWVYFKKSGAISDLYYIDLISHPTDLNMSNIESERLNENSQVSNELTFLDYIKIYVKIFIRKLFSFVN